MRKPMRVGLLGASGFVGSAILSRFSKSLEHECLPITRGDNLEVILKDVDFVIHCANSAKRVVANSKPDEDRRDSLDKTIKILEASNGKPILLVSSISCRTQSDTPYGMNRLDCEREVLRYGGSIVRLGPMFGGTRTADVIHDICKSRKVFLARSTQYSFSNVNWNGTYIADNFERISGTIEIGARNAISLGELALYANSESEFIGENDDQFPLGFTDGPDVSEVYEYVDRLLSSRN